MASIEVLNGPHRGESHALPEQGLLIGRVREADIDVGLGTRWVSGLHARVWCEHGVWWVLDEGSTNGTFLLGERIERLQLEPGMEVTFGDVTVRFDLAAEVHPPPFAHEPPTPPPAVVPPRPTLSDEFEWQQPAEPAKTEPRGQLPDEVGIAVEVLHERCVQAAPVYQSLEELLYRLERSVEDGEGELRRTANAFVGPRGELTETLVDLKEVLDDLTQAAARLQQVVSGRR
jgi:pSer/pThr/pTyr-binding forkhead associated (FHA) protein